MHVASRLPWYFNPCSMPHRPWVKCNLVLIYGALHVMLLSFFYQIYEICSQCYRTRTPWWHVTCRTWSLLASSDWPSTGSHPHLPSMNDAFDCVHLVIVGVQRKLTARNRAEAFP